MIRVQGASVFAPSPDGRGSVTILDDATCTLAARRTAVVGENGSGKSTLARVIGGLIKSEGSVDAPERIGFLFSNPGAQPVMPTVQEDVALSFRGRGLSRAEIRERTASALQEHRLTDLAEHSCHSLSSGQQQRLALCAILAGEPELVIADEPTSFLDGRHRRIVRDRLFAGDAPDLLLVTHDLELASRCDEAILVEAGRITMQGPADAVVATYEKSLE
ncbi:energy-coupling factor ABC transporter ATP-binding protein [Agrococcus casei]|uniref:energy-coupling factor ABC transporter ATP-binding protein n=1 Tax=Agrococcus casei TaxID=343512 RepID=UPI003F8F771E